tara:strand:+ start:2090 stop:3502 length:1413 start_codon:yes stop_codon:yes gene_type:complete
MKTIFIVIYGNFTIRYFLLSGLYKKLSKDFKIIILSEYSNDEKFIKKYKYDNVTFENLYLSKYQKFYKSTIYKFFSKIRRLTLRSNKEMYTIQIKEKFLIEDIKSFNIKAKLFYWFCIYFSRISNSFDFLRDLLIFLENKSFKTFYHQKIYDKYKPHAIIINDLGTIDHTNFIMREVKHNKVKIISLILSWDNLTAKGIGSIIPDYALVWNKIMYEEIIENHGLNEDKVKICGIPQFDMLIDNENYNFDIFPFSSKDNKIIYYPTGSPSWFCDNVKNIALILDIIKNQLKNNDIKLVVRPHPAYFTRDKFINEITEMKELQKLNSNIFYLNIPEFLVSSTSKEFTITDQNIHKFFVKKSNLILTSFSTMILEAAIFDKPVINIGFDKIRKLPHYQTHSICSNLVHLNKVLSYKFSPVAKKKSELIYYIINYLDNPKLDSEKRKKLFNDYININFGKSTTKISSEIKNILK